MNARITPEAENALAVIAQRYGISPQSALSLLGAVHRGGGTMAQFSVPELGSGQWMRGGMVTGGDLFDHARNSRVDGLCNELAQLLTSTTVFHPAAAGALGGFATANWWPADLGVPSSTGQQNETRYAIFPSTRRLAIHHGGVTRVYETADHHIGGVQQQQGSGYGAVSFTSQLGTFGVSSLREVAAQQTAGTPDTQPAPPRHSEPQPQAPAPVSADAAAVVAAIESLAGLHERGFLTDEEFSAKKAELLGRL